MLKKIKKVLFNVMELVKYHLRRIIIIPAITFFIISLMYLVYDLFDLNVNVIEKASALYGEILTNLDAHGFEATKFLEKLSAISYMNIILSSFSLFFGKRSFNILTEYIIEAKFGRKHKMLFVLCLISCFVLVYAQSANKLFLAICQIVILLSGILLHTYILFCFFSNIANVKKQVKQYIDIKLSHRKSGYPKTVLQKELHYTIIYNLGYYLFNSLSSGESDNWTPLSYSVIKTVIAFNNNSDFNPIHFLLEVFNNSFNTNKEYIEKNRGFFVQSVVNLIEELFVETEKQESTENLKDKDTLKKNILVALVVFLSQRTDCWTAKSVIEKIQYSSSNSESTSSYTKEIMSLFYAFAIKIKHICVCRSSRPFTKEEEKEKEYEISYISILLLSFVSEYKSENESTIKDFTDEIKKTMIKLYEVEEEVYLVLETYCNNIINYNFKVFDNTIINDTLKYYCISEEDDSNDV